MSAQPSPDDQQWLDRNRPRKAHNPRLKGIPSGTRPATTDNDILDLHRNEEILTETRDTMVDRVEQLDATIKAHVRAKVAWRIHHHRATKRLEGFGSSRTNEDTRLAYAIAFRDEETGAEGADLYRDYMETEGELDALRTALDVQRTVVSATQTLINHGAKASGLG